MKTSKRALKYCANYNCGKCLGVIITRKLNQFIDLDLADKRCKLELGYLDRKVMDDKLGYYIDEALRLNRLNRK